MKKKAMRLVVVTIFIVGFLVGFDQALGTGWPSLAAPLLALVFGIAFVIIILVAFDVYGGSLNSSTEDPPASDEYDDTDEDCTALDYPDCGVSRDSLN